MLVMRGYRKNRFISGPWTLPFPKIPARWARRSPKQKEHSLFTTRLGILRVQVPYNQILTQNLYYHCYYLKSKYLIIGYLEFLGKKEGSVWPLPSTHPQVREKQKTSMFIHDELGAIYERLGSCPVNTAIMLLSSLHRSLGSLDAPQNTEKVPSGIPSIP